MIILLDRTGNNHDAVELRPINDDQEKDEEKSSYQTKDRSILQSKLTTLAIQIGYAG